MNKNNTSNTVTISVEEYAHLLRSHAFLQAILHGSDFERKTIATSIARYLGVDAQVEE